MPTTNAHELVQLLSGPTLIHRTGLWLAPLTLLGHEADEAARLNLDAVDFCARVLARVPADSKFAGLSAARVLELLNAIAQDETHSACVLVYNLDLAVARLRQQERSDVWTQLYSAFPHRARALLLLMPSPAYELLPERAALRQWARDSRLVTHDEQQFEELLSNSL